MFYPLKFKSVYKDYMWGGRNLESLGKALPHGIVAESWEISCHPDGVSTVSNGQFAGIPLPELVKKYGRQLIGTALPEESVEKFPLLIKLIDANNKLSVQVHPEDSYAKLHENGELGKNEMWHIISAKPGAKLIYGVTQGTDASSFAAAVKDGKIQSCLKEIEVMPGDTLNIPAGLVHAIGEGIVLAEVQQNSNTTYRVYDYDRVDSSGNKRPLHIEKALDVIDFNSNGRKEKAVGLKVNIDSLSSKTYKIANKYFSVELYDIKGSVDDLADGSRFLIYVFIRGEGRITYNESSIEVRSGESVLIPASLGAYSIKGDLEALKAYVPDLESNVVAPLKQAGYSEEEIFTNVAGLEYRK